MYWYRDIKEEEGFLLLKMIFLSPQNKLSGLNKTNTLRPKSAENILIIVAIMCRNDELSLMMSWVGCLLTNSDLFILFAENS